LRGDHRIYGRLDRQDRRQLRSLVVEGRPQQVGATDAQHQQAIDTAGTIDGNLLHELRRLQAVTVKDRLHLVLPVAGRRLVDGHQPRHREQRVQRCLRIVDRIQGDAFHIVADVEQVVLDQRRRSIEPGFIDL